MYLLNHVLDTCTSGSQVPICSNVAYAELNFFQSTLSKRKYAVYNEEQ